MQYRIRCHIKGCPLFSVALLPITKEKGESFFMKWKVRTLVFLGLLVGLSVILTRFSIMPVPTIRIGFRDIPIILAGILFGPLAGLVTGVAADLIGFLISSGGTFFIGFTISAALVGFLPGLVFWKHDFTKKFPLLRIIIAVILVEGIISLFLNTLWLTVMYGKAFGVILPARATVRLITIPLETIIIAAILQALQKSGILDRQ